MSDADSDEDRAEELTARYRAASAADPARPSEFVRESIFAYARTAAGDPATRPVSIARGRRRAAIDSYWPVTAAASLIVASLATVLAWHFHAPTPVPAQAPNPSPPQVLAHDQAATESTASGQPSEPFPTDRPATVTPAPNAVTTRSRERAGSSARAPSPAHDMAVEQRTEGANVARAQVAPAPAAAPSPNVQQRRFEAPDAAAARTSPAASSLLVAAAEAADLERVQQLLQSGISTEQTDGHGRTALLVATLRGDVAMVQHLLAAGARVDVVDDDGDTPLAVAQRRGPPELIRLLERASPP